MAKDLSLVILLDFYGGLLTDKQALALDYYYNQDLTGPLGIVIGNEGKGISEKVKKNCDFNVKIPMKGQITSLNASVSAGIIIYEALKQRIK